MQQETHQEIGYAPIDFPTLQHLIEKQPAIAVAKEAQAAIEHCRTFLEQQLAEKNRPFYGINTGFGSLCNIRISEEAIEQLQSNLVQSHACGMGDQVPAEVVRLMMITKVQSLSQGYSGVRWEVVERLQLFLNKGIVPVIFQQGSLGASGDLAPLAHLSLALMGQGDVYWQGAQQPAAAVHQQLGIRPLKFAAKEGLALLNGTQFSTSYGLWSLLEMQHLLFLSAVTAALSIDGFHCSLDPFDPKLHAVRRHPGQIQTATWIRGLLSDSVISAKPKEAVQDPYAFRCVPQVHGASWDAFEFAKEVLLREANAVTDNPNIFPESGEILSGGNFHAQPVALPLDYLAIAAAELASISERRTYQLISGQRGLPAFLIADPGLHSGFMIPQYTAASIVSQNKQLCTPASVDSIVSSNGQEDHVSMAANAGTKLYRVLENAHRVLAIEFMNASQALSFRKEGPTGSWLHALLQEYREVVPVLKEDRKLYLDMEKSRQFLREKRRKIQAYLETLD